MTQNNESDFVTIALPRELVERIDIFVENSNHMYLNRPHVIKVALAKFFENDGGEKVERNGKSC